MSSFKSGSISMQMFAVSDAIKLRTQKELIEQLAAKALPPVDTLGDGSIAGWTGHRHDMDRQISEESATLGGYLLAQYVKAQRVIPSSLFKAEVKLEEMAQLAASGQERLSARARSEIREAVTSRLQPQAMPNFKATQFVIGEPREIAFASTTSQGHAEELSMNFANATGIRVVPMTPEVMAARLKIDVRQWDPACFSDDADGEPVSDRAGHDFLTWFWFIAEARRGLVTIKDLGEFGLLLEGPLTFVMDGGGAHRVRLDKGEPRVAAEAKAALQAGKKLAACKIAFARGDELWSCRVDGDFIFRGLKLPQTEQLDPVSRFQDRMRLLETFQSVWIGLFEQFATEHNDTAIWTETVKDMRRWVSGRYARN